MQPFQRYREQIDASRPGSADLQLPELAELAKALESDMQLATQLDRAHENDIALHQALHAVDQPSGLNDRLLGRLFTPAVQTAGPMQAVIDQPPAVECESLRLSTAAAVVSTPAVPHLSRRKWLAAALATAALALVAVSAKLWSGNQPQQRSREQLAENIERWMQQARSPNGWNNSPVAATLADYPLDSAIRVNPIRSRPLVTATRDRGAIYDLTLPGRQRAILFVVRTGDEYAVDGTPYSVIQASGGHRIGAWQAGNLLYVLAVEDRQRLESFLHARPLTMSPRAPSHAALARR